jgi:hypothetical protein
MLFQEEAALSAFLLVPQTFYRPSILRRAPPKTPLQNEPHPDSELDRIARRKEKKEHPTLTSYKTTSIGLPKASVSPDHIVKKRISA